MYECLSFFLPWVHSFPQTLRGTQNSKVKNYWLGAKHRSWGGCQSLQQRAVAPTLTDLFDLTTLVIKRSERWSQVGLSQEYQKRTLTCPCSSCWVGFEIPFPTHSWLCKPSNSGSREDHLLPSTFTGKFFSGTLFWALLLLCHCWFFLLLCGHG